MKTELRENEAEMVKEFDALVEKWAMKLHIDSKLTRGGQRLIEESLASIWEDRRKEEEKDGSWWPDGADGKSSK